MKINHTFHIPANTALYFSSQFSYADAVELNLKERHKQSNNKNKKKKRVRERKELVDM